MTPALEWPRRSYRIRELRSLEVPMSYWGAEDRTGIIPAPPVKRNLRMVISGPLDICGFLTWATTYHPHTFLKLGDKPDCSLWFRLVHGPINSQGQKQLADRMKKF